MADSAVLFNFFATFVPHVPHLKIMLIHIAKINFYTIDPSETENEQVIKVSLSNYFANFIDALKTTKWPNSAICAIFLIHTIGYKTYISLKEQRHAHKFNKSSTF